MAELTATLATALAERWGVAVPFFEYAEKAAAVPTSVGFRALFARVPRLLGAAARQPLGQEWLETLPAARPHWTLTDVVRLWLLLRGFDAMSRPAQAGWVLSLFEVGEIGEQVSILRILSALPEPGRFIETGEQACRHNSLDVFEAIVAENPFLADHFPPLSFNQAVMKSLFLQVSVKRIERLELRITPELSRMVAGYASERRAAGRPVPEDVTYLSQYGA